MKKLLTIIGLLAVLGTLTRVCAEGPYRAQEFQIDGFYQSTSIDLDDERGAVGIGGNLFLTRNLGLGISTALEDLNGSTIDSISVRGIFRAPINQYAFYAFGGGTRELDSGDWSIQAGPGFEWRWTPNFGPWAEIGFTKQLTGSRDIAAQARLGLRVSF